MAITVALDTMPERNSRKIALQVIDKKDVITV